MEVFLFKICRPKTYVPTFYPGTIDAAAAAQVEVAAGGQLTGMNLKLTKSRTVRVRAGM